MSALFSGSGGPAEAVGKGVQYIDKAPHSSYQFPYHQDNAYGQFWEPAIEMATGALALDSQGADTGAIVVLKGSHKLSVFPHTPSTTLGECHSVARTVSFDFTQLTASRHCSVPIIPSFAHCTTVVY